MFQKADISWIESCRKLETNKIIVLFIKKKKFYMEFFGQSGCHWNQDQTRYFNDLSYVKRRITS